MVVHAVVVRAEPAEVRDRSARLMPRDIEPERLRQLVEKGQLQLIEVLPETEYAEEHIAGAINIPLKSMNRSSVAALDASLPTVVYCWDDI